MHATIALRAGPQWNVNEAEATALGAAWADVFAYLGITIPTYVGPISALIGVSYQVYAPRIAYTMQQRQGGNVPAPSANSSTDGEVANDAIRAASGIAPNGMDNSAEAMRPAPGEGIQPHVAGRRKYDFSHAN